jgi:hypothetical protein
VLAKNSDTNFDTHWVNPPAGGLTGRWVWNDGPMGDLTDGEFSTSSGTLNYEVEYLSLSPTDADGHDFRGLFRMLSAAGTQFLIQKQGDPSVAVSFIGNVDYASGDAGVTGSFSVAMYNQFDSGFINGDSVTISIISAMGPPAGGEVGQVLTKSGGPGTYGWVEWRTPSGVWVSMTAAAYAALTPKDPNTLYVIKG